MKFILIDDHFLIREALRGILRELDADATILEASRWSEASELIEACPDVSLVLLDLVLPDRDGFAALEEIRRRDSQIPVVILSGKCDRDDVARSLEHGALGFIPKSGERKVMLTALQLVLGGGVYIPPEILRRGAPLAPAQRGSPRAEGSPADFGLTARQIDVLALMMRGKSNKAICRILDLAEATVRNHVTAILRSLKVTNRTEAVVMVGALGWELPRLDEDSMVPFVPAGESSLDRPRRVRPREA
jgi:DNA-binding NarL/FixJ family response regulator